MTYKNEHLTRQLGLVPMDILGTPITIIGAGAIGGWTTLALAKMGFGNLTVFDFDDVDTVNLNSQFYRREDVGHSKVESLARLVRDFTGTLIVPRRERYQVGTFPGVVIAAVDSMAARRTIWEQHVKRAPFTKAIIDPRMGGQDALLYVMDPMDARDQGTYPKTLYSDARGVQEACTAKATIYTANLLAGLTVKAVRDVLVRPDYLRIAQWNIAEDAFEAVHR